MLVLKLRHQLLDDLGVSVVATEPIVTAGDFSPEDVVSNVEEGDVEGAATRVEGRDNLPLVTLVEAVGQGGHDGLVDDATHDQARNLASLLGGLASSVGEVGGNDDDRVGDGLTEIGLGVPLRLLWHEG